MSQGKTGGHHRRSVRLQGYDYSQAGAYFVTICTVQQAELLGQVTDGGVQLNAYGQIVEDCWKQIPAHFPHASVDAYVVMPNHVHGTIIIDRAEAGSNGNPVGATHASPLPENVRPHGPRPGSLGAIVGAFKSAAARRINRRRGTPGTAVWQRNYYEHIVRSERALDAIREYIHQNPVRWELDRYNPSAVGRDSQAVALWHTLK